MKFTAQEEYGLRCLIAIACAGPEASLTIPEISRREGLSVSHVAKLLGVLRKAKYIRSTRGQAGGYCLDTPAESIRVLDVLESLGGRLYGAGFCDRHSGVREDCVHETDCLIRPVWTRLQNAVNSALEGVTLQDVIDSKLDNPSVIFYQRPDRLIEASHS